MNTEENKSEPVPELTPEMQKIVAAAVAQAMAQQQPQAAGSNVNPPAEKTTSPAPSADFSEPKGTPGEWGMWLALRSCLTRYADFAGRASRSEFWYTVLANFLVIITLELLVVLGVFLAVCTGTTGVVVAVICGLLLLSYNILMMVPGLSVAVRRMHDTGRSGWAICFYFIPLAGPIIFLLFALGESGEANQYGKAPNHPVSDDEKAPAIVAWVIKTCRTLFVDNIGKTMVYGGGGVAAIAAVWTGLHFLLAPANPLKPLYEEGLLNEKSLGFGAAGKLNRAYQQYLEGDMEITDYPFVPELLKVAHDKEFSLSVEVVQALVEAGADINAVSGSDTVWAHAFELGDPAILQYLVSAGVQKQDTYSTFSGENCFMHQAVATDKPEMLRAMAAVGCNVDFRRSDDDVTALMIAINQEKPEMIKLLAELKADFNAYFMNGEQKVTVFEVAADKSPEMLALVEELGALPTGEIAAARLFEIADKGDLDAFNAMKAKGVDMVSLSKMTDKHGSTPLMIAANFASADFVKAMIDAGFDVNAKGNTGDTPLIYGAKRPDNVKALLEAGADVNAVNNEGKSALTRAVGSNAEDSIRLLAQAGADIKAAVEDDYSYLTYAAKNNKCKSIRALIELGADVNAADAGGKTPLYRAVMADKAEAIKTLVELGANLQERNEKTHTLLHIAAGYNKAAALKQLLACPGADVNVTMLENTTTPLHIAAIKGSAECVKVLLETPGVNVNATISYGDGINFTALHFAATYGHEEVIKLLLADSRTDINARGYDKKKRKYFHSITLLAEEGHDACLKLFLDTRAVPADDVKEASKAAVFHGTQKTVELLMWYTPDEAKVKAMAARKSSGSASTQSSAESTPGTTATDTPGTTDSGSEDTPVADDGMEELESFITALKEMNPKDSTQKLYCKRLLTLLPEIARGADVNLTLKETKGNTALHYACGMGHVELVTWLVQHGADVTKRTDRGKTPMECAGGNVEAIRAALGL